MHKRFAASVAMAGTLFVCVSLAGAQGRYQPPETRIARPQPGGTLTVGTSASPRAVLAQYLRDRGRDEITSQSIVLASQGPVRNGVSQVTFEQRAGGLAVHGTYAKATFNTSGELVHLIENFATVPEVVGRARISQPQAVAAAIRHLYPDVRANAAYWHQAPSATRVAIPNADGTMSAGFLVETWTEAANQLHYTLVGGDGSILDVELRTSTDKYNIFAIHPLVSAQTVVDGPGPGGNAQSPSGWLFSGTQGSTHIAGNNVASYLDVVSNNRSDANGTAITNGEFVTPADLSVTPSNQSNREVAVQNLFYLNNVIHDELYSHGFTEAAGNFQENNFGLGGRGSDSVNAEAQDGGGTDNANFATPRDGSNPRMQMYLWSGSGVNQVVVGTTVYPAQGAEFGPALTATGLTATIDLANDGVAPTSDACETLPAGSLSAKIALIDRGTCDFVVKVKNAQNAGAIAAVVANNVNGDTILTMGGSDPSITIPSVFVSQNSGTALKAIVPVTGTVRLTAPPPLMVDGDLDSDIVYHEYCHGLTWRMIGRMSGALAGAIGEGMSDVCALLMNEDDRIGEYAASDPRGIRRFPYAGYPNTYGDVTGAGVHNDGEIYAAIGWQMLQNFGTARKSDLFGYLVSGMNYTPAAPNYEEMRDGILQAVALNTLVADDDCRVWRAFAQFGVGVGAQGTARGSRATIVESFTLPGHCTP